MTYQAFTSILSTKETTVKLKLLLLSYGVIASCAFADNPIIPDQGVCDPHIHVFNGKAYLFADHDYALTNKWYHMRDWWVWSSSDLVNWKKEFTLLPENTYTKAMTDCWATDGATRDGKYFFYFSRGNKDGGVAVGSNGPGGPYVDALGKALGRHDPTVFINDDPNQTPYYIGGKFPYSIAKMNNDMISLAEKPRSISYDDTRNKWRPTDGNFLHKHNEIYYLNQHSSLYGTSTNIYGPYTFRGSYAAIKQDHGTWFTWNNQTYNAYGTPDASRFYRKTSITYIAYKDNGEMVADPFIASSSLGVGQYDANWDPIQAEWYFAASDGTSKNEGASGFEMRNLGNDSYLYYPKVRNMAKNTPVSFCVSSANPRGGTIEIRKDSPTGTLLGSCTIPNTGGWTTYKTFNCNLTNSASTYNICLVFKGDGTELMRLDWFTFLPGTGGTSIKK